MQAQMTTYLSKLVKLSMTFVFRAKTPDAIVNKASNQI